MKTKDDVAKELASIKDDVELDEKVDHLIEGWEQSQLGVVAIKPILQFMEQHPDWNYGMPGSLVHFMETFYRAGYEDELLRSVERHPIMHTTWMLNRVINGERDSARRRVFLNALSSIQGHKLADTEVVEFAKECLEMHTP
jgi:hypothetical protein